MKALLFSLSLLVMIGCNDHRALEMADSIQAVSMDMAPAATLAESIRADAVPPVSMRMLIKDGSLRFKTEDLKKTKSDIAQICKSTNAYSSHETMNDDDHSISQHQVIRVPAERFEELIQKIELLADTLDERTIESRDVTEEFIDVEARLKTKREVEKRYLELLKQAKTVDNMLAIEREVGEVRTEIESMEGRLKYLKNQVAFSTLTLDYYQVIETPFGFAPRMASSFATGWENLLSFLVGVSTAWPFIILLSAGAWGIRRWSTRKRAPVSQSDAS